MGLLRRGLAWLRDKCIQKAESFLLHVLAAGPIPNHIAFVMDGNRRYARVNGKPVQDGHAAGFDALRRVLEICLRLNVRCVSVYAFSIENFKRSAEEVDALMKLAEAKILEICEHGDLLEEYGVRLNVIGKRHLLPVDVQNAARKAESMTRHHSRAVLNLCMPYTSRDEMTTAVQCCVQDAVDECDAKIITEAQIEACLMTARCGSPPLDLLVRTSGVKRLSDFLLWQCCEDTQVQFSSTYWPNFGLLDFIPIVLDFQRKIEGERLF